jgi:putative ABC transport system permease protein
MNITSTFIAFFRLRTWKLGVSSLFLHPMRSALTVLGIFIGVASVIWLLAIGEGISKEAQARIEDLGAENIIIRSIKPPDGAGGGSFRQIDSFGVTRAEQKLIGSTIPTVRRVHPIREMPQRFVYSGNPNGKPIDGRLVGCTEDYDELTRLFVSRGRFLSAIEIEQRKSVCVIAANLATKLFPSVDPMYKEIYLPEKKEYFSIVGVLKPRNATAAIGGSLAAQDFSLDVYIPITTMRQRLSDLEIRRSGGTFSAKIYELSQITVEVEELSQVKQTAKLVEATLMAGDPTRQDVAIVVPFELLEQAEITRLMFMLFMGLIAAISLVVGGIGIMNIMLATVTERTREIGIRRALGAKRSDIVLQFLVETISLSVIGGITGILGGLACRPAVEFARNVIAESAPRLYAGLPEDAKVMTPEIVPLSIPVAFCISVMVGVFFGLYPAYRAAQMDPIEALRHE